MFMARTKHPIQYELEPPSVDAGAGLVVLSLKNIGTEKLTDLDVGLHSTDTYNLVVVDIKKSLSLLESHQKINLEYQITAYTSCWVYATLDGFKDGKRFHTESPLLKIRVLPEIAEIVSVFALAKPQIPTGEQIQIEATVRALSNCENLTLEFWTDAPDGEFKELATIQIAKLSKDEVGRYGADITPSQEGLYKITAYLYDGIKRVDAGVDQVMVTDPKK
jgi:hypothetical protein